MVFDEVEFGDSGFSDSEGHQGQELLSQYQVSTACALLKTGGVCKGCRSEL